MERKGLVENTGLTATGGGIWGITEKGLRFLKENRYRLDKFLIYGDTDRFYLQLIKEFSKRKGVKPLYIAEKANLKDITVSARLRKLYR